MVIDNEIKKEDNIDQINSAPNQSMVIENEIKKEGSIDQATVNVGLNEEPVSNSSEQSMVIDNEIKTEEKTSQAADDSSSSSSESDSEEEDVHLSDGLDDELDEIKSDKPPKTQHEITALPPVKPITVVLEANEDIRELGRISSLLPHLIILESIPHNIEYPSALQEGSIVCTAERVILGEVFIFLFHFFLWKIILIFFKNKDF